MKMDQQDPFAFIVDLCYISPSQEELLRRCPFVGEPDHEPPPCSAADPVASDGILMMSLPETQLATKDASGSGPQDQDVFHTPPEKSSVPTSSDIPLDRCTVNRAVDVDDGTSEFVDLRGNSEGTVCVDLGTDSDLGFSEVQLTQVIDEELVDGSPRGIKRDAGGDKFGGFERELGSQDGISEMPMKILRLSDPKSGFDSPRASLSIESQKVEEGNGNCKGKRGSGAETPSCNVGADLQPQQVVRAGEQQVSGENRISREKKLGSSLENAANVLEGGQQKEKNKLSVFDVLKLLSEDSNSDDEDDDDNEDGLENVSLLEAFKSRGLTFPRPRWWPDNDNYRKQRIA